MTLTAYAEKQMAARQVETIIVREIITALENANLPVIAIFDGSDRVTVNTPEEILNHAFNLDEIVLITANGNVLLTMGQGAYILSDYHVTLEEALERVHSLIDGGSPIDVWLKFDSEDDEESTLEANTFLDGDGFRIEWYHTAVGLVSEVYFRNYEDCVNWYSENGFSDFTS